MHLWKPHIRADNRWPSKKARAVPHNSNDAENISFDAVLRLKGIPALNLWDTTTDLLEPVAGRVPMHNDNP